MKARYGYIGRMLFVNLSDGMTRTEDLSEDLAKAFIGGYGIGSRIIYSRMKAGVDPLGPENIFALGTGPLTLAGTLSTCRFTAMGKSPLTGYWGDANSGGNFAIALKASGYDLVFFEGKAEHPVYLVITNGKPEIKDARNLWGLDPARTEEMIREENPGWDYKIVSIGIAGEKRVRLAAVINDKGRAAARSGLGAVMGSKKIKAIAFRGNRRKEVADPGLINRFVKEMSAIGKANAGVHAYKSMGTTMLVDIMNEAGGFPTRYWTKGRSEYRESFNASALLSRTNVKPRSCPKCYMACGKLASVKEGRHKGLKIEGPEYETIFAFGGLCEVNGIEEIMHLNDLCDRLGMDTISSGNLAAFTIEAARQGRIDAAIDYGDVDAIAQLLSDIAYNRGHGAVLAKGIKHAARQWDMEDQAIHVKGLEPPGYDPRTLKGMGLAYSSSARGACHLRATFYKPELAGMIPRDQIDGKAAMFVEWEDRLAIFDTLIICRFYRDLYQWDKLSEIIRGATGLSLDVERMRKMAAAVIDATRLFNIREGLTMEDDYLPKRFLTEALPETGNLITEEQMLQLLLDYYQARGWDEKGVPSHPM